MNRNSGTANRTNPNQEGRGHEVEGGGRRSGSSSELEEMVLPGQAKRSMEGHIREPRFFQKEPSRIV
ncbi:MAG: hypothetical protein JRJ59_03960, partial [Deltaproteobacteria bacterium]|nr:hypothetical protein [Deltaproteobacteria bacterium]